MCAPSMFHVQKTIQFKQNITDGANNDFLNYVYGSVIIIKLFIYTT